MIGYLDSWTHFQVCKSLQIRYVVVARIFVRSIFATFWKKLESFESDLAIRRIVGLEKGVIVYDGPPEDLTPEVLTKIYGEENWEATIGKVDEDEIDEQ